jgi:sec-independent protein translocase protein TatB
VFGFSFGELVVFVIIAIVVIGPKDLPKVLRKLGRWAGQLRRMASDLRAQSGIDEVLRSEGLTEDLMEIRKLARGELDTISRQARVDPTPAPSLADSPLGARTRALPYEDDATVIGRDREHPKDGPDTMNAMPDTAFVYADGFPRSKWADDPVWVHGDPNAVVEKKAPPPEAKAGEPPAATPDPA